MNTNPALFFVLSEYPTNQNSLRGHGMRESSQGTKCTPPEVELCIPVSAFKLRRNHALGFFCSECVDDLSDAPAGVSLCALKHLTTYAKCAS